MRSAVESKKVVLGVTGSIACYKAVDLCSKLVQGGALVDVILTEAAQKFVAPLTFRSITHRPVVTDVFDAESELSVEHVALADSSEATSRKPKLKHGLPHLQIADTSRKRFEKTTYR